MCGIAGWEAQLGTSVPAEAALGAMRHRGPDGGWTRRHGSWELVQTRLAVIDLSPDVRYPMLSEDGEIALLFNGEIYNHRELQRELTGRGHTFATSCDAEVVLHGWEQWGAALFPRLNGMWAFALADRRTGKLVLARDRFGIKPLVRTVGGRFAFASDARTLVRCGLSLGSLNHEAIAAYAAFHYVPEPHTGVAGIEQIPPGHYLERDAGGGGERLSRWARPLFAPDRRVDPVPVEEAEAVLLDAVSRQLVADVPVGVFLSGGTDSALMLSLAVEAGARPLAFTLGFAGHGGYDETQAAMHTARRFGVPHRVEALDLDLDSVLARHAAAYDTPFADSSAIATLPLAARARAEVTVALSGTGGDDLFAGYYRHRLPWFHASARRLPRPLLDRLARLDPARGAERSTRSSLARSYAIRLAESARQDLAEAYLTLLTSGTSARALAALPELDVRGAARRVAARNGLFTATRPDLDALQRFELATYLPGDLLVKEDRATMAYSLEARVPLLDEVVARLADRAPGTQRASMRLGKRLLHDVARKRGLLSRRAPKRGFAVPLGDLFAGKWNAPARAALCGAESDLVDGHVAAPLLDQPRVHGADVWMLLALATWERELRAARRSAVAAGLA
jgi:asparagine synthase (glutamine-hydrolysing)